MMASASSKSRFTEEELKKLAALREGQDRLGLVGIVAASTDYLPGSMMCGSMLCGWPRKSPASIVLDALVKKSAQAEEKNDSDATNTADPETHPEAPADDNPPPSITPLDATDHIPPPPPTTQASIDEGEKRIMELKMKTQIFQMMGLVVQAHPCDSHHGNHWPYPCGLFILFTIKMYMMHREIAAREASGIFDDGTKIPIKTAHMYWLANLKNKNLVKCIRMGDYVLAQQRAMPMTI